MAILQGSWITNETSGYLFIWGEMWRTMASVESPGGKESSCHPFAMTQDEFTAFLGSHRISIDKFLESNRTTNSETRKGGIPNLAHRWQRQGVTLPTQPSSAEVREYPILSTQLPWVSTETPPLELKLWTVEGFRLNPSEAIQFL
ncbi:MAG TPA: ATP-dependent helicase, partial [Cyanobacteria bacterium UBA12227]|nr:ATP-dependent helicase [Cyanobacteria bacterium UBA12227]